MRRIPAVLGACALVLSLAACGDQASDAAGGLDSVTVAGEFGKAPEVTWNSPVTTETMASSTLIEGEGEEVAMGETVKLNIWIGNGFSQSQAYSSWDKDGKATPETAELIPDIPNAIREATVGHQVGDRTLVVSGPADSFGDAGNPGLGIGNADPVVWIVDIVAKVVVLDGPQGDAQQPPAWAPRLVLKDGEPTGFDFSKSPANPGKKLQTITLIKGDGVAVASGQTVTVNYLGMVYGSTKVFDQSYDGAPYPTQIGVGRVIKGWDQAIVGATVGSRLLLVIPAELAYGDAGQGEDIKPGDTLTFVVDILSAS